MPRRRKAARAFRSVSADALEIVRTKCKNKWFANLLRVEDFFTDFPSAEERSAYQALYPGEFFRLFSFEKSPFDDMPASISRVTDSHVFKRLNFAADFLEQHPAKGPFEPPDLRAVPYMQREPMLAKARAAWWVANDWPLSDEETQWLERGGPDPGCPRYPSEAEMQQVRDHIASWK